MYKVVAAEIYFPIAWYSEYIEHCIPSGRASVQPYSGPDQKL